jgi:exodeoxyribonuclease VII large subunit
MEPRIGTVSQINQYVKKILDNNIILNNVWVKGEISNFKHHYSGHIYLTLKDEGGVLKAVMFKSSALGLTFTPSDGMKVMARGRVSVYEAGGAYQLYIEEMIPDGVGELYIAYEKLKKKLESEGLFDESHKKPIPKFPAAVGVATATTGAAVRDIINVITRRCPMTKIIIFPTQVQGAGAAQSVVRAIEYFNTAKNVDTIIAGRGGGSIEDLWAFNEEITARAIYASKIPIISAVGHETDFTIADFVADLRAPTPSAAAEIAVPSALELRSKLKTDSSRISGAILKQLSQRRLKLSGLRLKKPSERIQENSQRLDNMVKRMEQSFRLRIAEKRRVIGTIAGKVDAMSPLKVLSRGYSIPVDINGSVIRSVNDMKSGKEFILKMTDGETECIVKQEE